MDDQNNLLRRGARNMMFFGFVIAILALGYWLYDPADVSRLLWLVPPLGLFVLSLATIRISPWLRSVGHSQSDLLAQSPARPDLKRS